MDMERYKRQERLWETMVSETDGYVIEALYHSAKRVPGLLRCIRSERTFTYGIYLNQRIIYMDIPTKPEHTLIELVWNDMMTALHERDEDVIYLSGGWKYSKTCIQPYKQQRGVK